ncbi:putative nrps-like enzyme protein [Botrytis fragariae]|uniref:Putative nrps-like enzyme protein n=1 Tax=Botrytis fragariae TaxID=1964551 RepID=A0A8H6EIL8_9HELO|nr:putative nrps-like enzyme protein [Botrytis fragariae]KAF5873603.1 putative nrps-like enzyme protein [Botrytis fragariae]
MDPFTKPAYGEILLHQTLDYLSRVSPHRLYASIPHFADFIDLFRDLDFLCCTGVPYSGSTFAAGALVIGNGRVRATLLLEPKPQVQDHERKSLIQTLWPCIEEANALAPGHGRILNQTLSLPTSHSHVRLTKTAFEKEIETPYKQTKLSTSNKIPSLRAIFERESVRNFVRAIAVSCFPIAANVSDDEDLFSHDLDSLRITELVAILRSGIAEHASSSGVSWISPEMAYQNPSIVQLVTICHYFLNPRRTPQGSNAQARISTMENLVRKYTHNLPVRSPYSPGDAPQTSLKMCIAVIGSTGTLGTVLLSTLLPNLRISRIYCLNRNVSARVTQESILANRGIDSSLVFKPHFMTVKIDSPNLGLPLSDYNILVDDIDIIIYNAWGPITHDSAPELTYLYPTKPPTTVPTTILRIGQISGSTSPTDPPWPKQEWLYPILLSSKTLCLLPQQLAPIDWVPIDLAAAVISEILASYGDASSISEAKYSSESEDGKNIQAYNIVNPAHISWDILDNGRQIKMLPLREWIEEIEKYSANLDVKTMGIEATLKPALKLNKRLGNGKALDDVRYMMEKSKRASRAMKEMGGIDREMIEMWLGQWGL